MSNYITKYKGIYRIMCPIDQHTKDFPREYDDTYADIDLYIKCYNDCKIFHYGHGILEFYCPSLGRGRNIVRAIQNEGLEQCIIYMEESDSEVLFRFRDKDMKTLEKFLKPVTSGAKIGPFSQKNLPKVTYFIPEEDLNEYKSVLLLLGDNPLKAGKLTLNYISSLATKKNPISNIKADMKLKGLKGKEYIHAIGHWDKFIKYLKKEVGT